MSVNKANAIHPADLSKHVTSANAMDPISNLGSWAPMGPNQSSQKQKFANAETAS